MRGLITLVDDNQVDNYLEEMLAFVYFCNNRPQNGRNLQSVSGLFDAHSGIDLV